MIAAINAGESRTLPALLISAQHIEEATRVVTVFHLVVSAISGIIGIGIALAAVDGEGPFLAVRAVGLTWQFLFFPITALSAVVDVGHWGAAGKVALFLTNSLVWGALAAIIWSWYPRRRERTAVSVKGAAAMGRRGAV